jgi:hypothetical protein
VRPGQTLPIELPNVPDCSAVSFSVVAATPITRFRQRRPLM